MPQTIRTFFSHPLRLALAIGFFICFLTVAAAPFIRAESPACEVFAPNLMTECNCDIPNPDNKAECLDDYYSSNGITLYDPNTPICEATPVASTTGELSGNDNAEKIFVFLVSKNLSAEQAAGVMGNLWAESRLDPAIEQGGRIVDASYTLIPNVGFGLAQWTDPSRQQALMTFQRGSGKTIIDLGMQLDFLWKELSNGGGLGALQATTTPEDAAYIFHSVFERSADSEATVKANRGGKAREYYEQFKALAPATPNSRNPTATPDNSCAAASGSGTNSGSADLLSDNFVIYNQCQYPPYGGSWGTIPTLGGRTACSDACAPTALAMISKNLAGMNVTPENTIDYWSQHQLWYSGGGSYTSSPTVAAGDFGLTIETIANKGDISAYRSVFDRGGAIMAISAGSSPFLPQRHAIVLRGIVNNGASFLIADPGYTETNKPPANQPSVDKILTDIRSDSASVVYAFYKK